MSTNTSLTSPRAASNKGEFAQWSTALGSPLGMRGSEPAQARVTISRRSPASKRTVSSNRAFLPSRVSRAFWGASFKEEPLTSQLISIGRRATSQYSQ